MLGNGKQSIFRINEVREKKLIIPEAVTGTVTLLMRINFFSPSPIFNFFHNFFQFHKDIFWSEVTSSEKSLEQTCLECACAVTYSIF